jgi:pyroglutamyl-peptidase
VTNILITGFEPFDQDRLNASWEAARQLDGLRLSSPHGPVTVQARQLPCVFGAANVALIDEIETLQPLLVICAGYAGMRQEISIERVAINLDDARIADNAGRQPIDAAIVEDGPAAYFSTLPIKAIAHALRLAQIPAGVSQSAGTFVCNHVFYGLQHYLATHRPQVRGGFIHVPYWPEQTTRHAGLAGMALEQMVEGLRLALQTSLEVATDLKESGGAIA